MTKTIKKQHRTDGVFNSNNEAYAAPQISRNTPLSDYKFTVEDVMTIDAEIEKIERESKQNNKY